MSFRYVIRDLSYVSYQGYEAGNLPLQAVQ